MDAIAEHGLAQLTMAGLGKRVGISGGHILYYFGSKDQLLVETLRWSEERLGERRAAIMSRGDMTVRDRIAAYVALYLPERRADPRWTLWLEVWARAPADAAVREAVVAIEGPWVADLRTLLVESGVRADAADRATEVVHTMLDGCAVRIVTGMPGADVVTLSDGVVEYVRGIGGRG